jgi:hypothetical protein
MPLFFIVVGGIVNLMAIFHPDVRNVATYAPDDFWAGLVINNVFLVVGVLLFVQEVRLRADGHWHD